ncbi:hypothetical protein WR25_15099 [Diploscapter pachys]|uniref:Uncharacterized protein n=1 Tax=Diploscapter pachys TaxID=2018661 RepID=A0A2A2LM45_9BILA|nr:hypothetical protein WR25_15099 [Diploscapter pachys]
MLQSWKMDTPSAASPPPTNRLSPIIAVIWYARIVPVSILQIVIVILPSSLATHHIPVPNDLDFLAAGEGQSPVRERLCHLLPRHLPMAFVLNESVEFLDNSFPDGGCEEGPDAEHVAISFVSVPHLQLPMWCQLKSTRKYPESRANSCRFRLVSKPSFVTTTTSDFKHCKG